VMDSRKKNSELNDNLVRITFPKIHASVYASQH